MRIPIAGGPMLVGDLNVPAAANGLVIFAHGSGSDRKSPRNRFVAGELARAGQATLLVDLLTPAEARADAQTFALRFDIGLLSARLAGVVRWARVAVPKLHLGLFGASTGAAAALKVAAALPRAVASVLSRGGRPDLAGPSLAAVTAPTLLLVGGRDRSVIRLNRLALAQLTCPRQLVLIKQAGHLFGEPGALEQVALATTAWFTETLAARAMPASRRSARRHLPSASV